MAQQSQINTRAPQMAQLNATPVTVSTRGTPIINKGPTTIGIRLNKSPVKHEHKKQEKQFNSLDFFGIAAQTENIPATKENKKEPLDEVNKDVNSLISGNNKVYFSKIANTSETAESFDNGTVPLSR